MKVFLKTYGCQMNVRDSEVICGLLTQAGYEIIADEKSADVVIINTCAVRQHAEDRVWSEIGSVVKKKERTGSKLPLIGLVGCMAQNHKDRAFQRSPGIDFVVGPSDIQKIPEIIGKLQKIGIVPKEQGESLVFESKIWETESLVRPEEIYHTGFLQDKTHSFVVISEGCSNYCAYCVVPFTRGALRHRRYQDILKEIEEGISQGVGKFTLLGQNVNAYHSDDVDFVKLLELVNCIPGLKEFTFLTSHPKDASAALFQAIEDLPKLQKNFHLPVQSGSDRILKLMNRGYDRKFYLDLADKYRKIVSNAALTTDIIVGFPTETEADFQDTRDLLQRAKFNFAYIFKYSPRPYTAAEKMSDDVLKPEKERRHQSLLELQKTVSAKK